MLFMVSIWAFWDVILCSLVNESWNVCNSYSVMGHGVCKELRSPSEIQTTLIQIHSTPNLAGNISLVPQGYIPVEKSEIT